MRNAAVLALALLVSFAVLGNDIVVAETPRQKVVLPAKLGIPAIADPAGVPRPWKEIARKFKAGDPGTRRWVERTLRSAAKWAARPDSYYLGLFRPETPFGVSSISCPIHPETSGWIPFDWDPDKPWRLTCPRCVKEGRKPAYYPNDLYPDDGSGCRPTDEAWRKTHDAAWSRKYKIPWKKWDGRTHSGSFAFFFLGYVQKRIFFELSWRRRILSNLCEGYIFASRLYPKASAEGKQADLYAHKAKLIMVTMSRAIMGDNYLRTVLALTEAEYRKAVRSLALDDKGDPLPYSEYPGYKERDSITDHSDDDPEHPISTIKTSWYKRVLTIFPDKNTADWAQVWLPSYAMIQPGFTPAERQARLPGLVERLLTAKAGDAERLKPHRLTVRPGIVDKGMNPYNFRLRGNLVGGPTMASINLGVMLGDREIIRNVAKAIYRYLRGGYFLPPDGFGCETSPHYTQVALSNLAEALATLKGMKEGFGDGDPFWDEQAKELNPYKDPALGHSVYSTLLSMLPDGLCAPWNDSWVTERPGLELAQKVANATGSVPERFLPWLDVSKDAAGKTRLQLKKAPTLPSYVIGANGVAVMRTGRGLDQTFVSVDWSKRRVHDGPFNLIFYSARHEMLFDQGYLNNDSPTNSWMGRAEAHNTALVRTADGSARNCITWRGKLRFFADTPTVKAVEVAEENQAKLKRGLPAGQRVLFQRTVTLLETDARPGGLTGAYLVDIFRLQGGVTHDYYVHGLGDEFVLKGAALQPIADPKMSLYDVSGFKYRTNTGARVITGIGRAGTDGTFTAVWRDMKDWRTMPPTVNKDVAVRVRILGEPGTEILVGTAPGQRHRDARDVAQRVTVMCVRRKAGAFREVPDAFVAVIDAGSPDAEAIGRVDRLAVVSGDVAAVGVRVARPGGVDYILSTTRDDVATVFSDPQTQSKLSLTGRLGVVRTRPGKPAALILLRGKRLARDAEVVER